MLGCIPSTFKRQTANWVESGLGRDEEKHKALKEQLEELEGDSQPEPEGAKRTVMKVTWRGFSVSFAF